MYVVIGLVWKKSSSPSGKGHCVRRCWLAGRLLLNITHIPVQLGRSNGLPHSIKCGATMAADVSHHSGRVCFCQSAPIHSLWAPSWMLPVEQQAQPEIRPVDESQPCQSDLQVPLLFWFVSLLCVHCSVSPDQISTDLSRFLGRNRFTICDKIHRIAQ